MGIYHIQDLVIEVTRRCNMQCSHCLRGCAENKDLSKKHIDKLFDDIDSINDLTFTGGEPLLNSKLIVYIIDKIIDNNISLNSFFLATNGTVFDKDVYHKLIDLYIYCLDYNYDEFYGGVSVSIDPYHEDYDNTILNYWKALSFYTSSKDTTANTYEVSLINEGLARDNGLGKRELLLDSDIDVDVDNNRFEGMLYVNVHGEILNDCDMSYTTQKDNVIGSVDEGLEALMSRACEEE